MSKVKATFVVLTVKWIEYKEKLELAGYFAVIGKKYALAAIC